MCWMRLRVWAGSLYWVRTRTGVASSTLRRQVGVGPLTAAPPPESLGSRFEAPFMRCLTLTPACQQPLLRAQTVSQPPAPPPLIAMFVCLHVCVRACLCVCVCSLHPVWRPHPPLLRKHAGGGGEPYGRTVATLRWGTQSCCWTVVCSARFVDSTRNFPPPCAHLY